MILRYRIALNETLDITNEYCSFDGYRPGAHMEIAYNGAVVSGEGERYERALAELFEQFNVRHPADYKHRSLSVGDVVTLTDESGFEFHYACEKHGWKLLEKFDLADKNPAWIDRNTYHGNKEHYEAIRRNQVHHRRLQQER